MRPKEKPRCSERRRWKDKISWRFLYHMQHERPRILLGKNRVGQVGVLVIFSVSSFSIYS